jgi:GH15 family glucan-1,4-alpha-glucosidase
MVYGELLDAAYLLREQMHSPRPGTCAFFTALADAAAAHWQEPDNGIWEVRGAPRHFLYSKLMCWVALDRAVRLADWLDAKGNAAGWQETADRVCETILARRWNEQVGAFTQSFGSAALDACALMLPITGFLPAIEPRVLSTIEAITENLTDPRGLVYRYAPGRTPIPARTRTT